MMGFIKGELIREITWDGTPIKIDSVVFNENIAIDPKFSFDSILPLEPIEGSFTCNVSPKDMKALKRLLKTKIPRKLKKKLYGTRSSRRKIFKKVMKIMHDLEIKVYD